MLDAIVEVGRYKGRTVEQALIHKEAKLQEILSAIADIRGSAPHLEKERHEVATTLNVLRTIYAENYSI